MYTDVFTRSLHMSNVLQHNSLVSTYLPFLSLEQSMLYIHNHGHESSVNTHQIEMFVYYQCMLDTMVVTADTN